MVSQLAVRGTYLACDRVFMFGARRAHKSRRVVAVSPFSGRRRFAVAAREWFKEFRTVVVALPTWPGPPCTGSFFLPFQPFVTYRQGSVARAASLRRHGAAPI